jgi:hypothetical protein
MKKVLCALVLACAAAAIAIAGASPGKGRPLNPYAAKYERNIAGMGAPDQSLESVMSPTAPISDGVFEPLSPQSKTCSQRCSTRCSTTCTTTRGCSTQCKVQTDGCGGSSAKPLPPAPAGPTGVSAILPTVARAPTGYFTLYSSQDEVRAVQGAPTAQLATAWRYGSSTVNFSNGVVVGYSNASKNLKVRVTPASPLSAVTFEVGSTQDTVLAAQGTPTSIVGNRWRYESSTVDFQDGVVSSYSNISNNLRVR